MSAATWGAPFELADLRTLELVADLGSRERLRRDQLLAGKTLPSLHGFEKLVGVLATLAVAPLDERTLGVLFSAPRSVDVHASFTGLLERIEHRWGHERTAVTVFQLPPTHPNGVELLRQLSDLLETLQGKPRGAICWVAQEVTIEGSELKP